MLLSGKKKHNILWSTTLKLTDMVLIGQGKKRKTGLFEQNKGPFLGPKKGEKFNKEKPP